MEQAQRTGFSPEVYKAFHECPEAYALLKELNDEIERQDHLLALRARRIAELEAELAVLRSDMRDPYEIATEIANKPSPSNDDMRRLRAAEVAIAYCGRPKLTGTWNRNVYQFVPNRERDNALVNERVQKLIGSDGPEAT